MAAKAKKVPVAMGTGYDRPKAPVAPTGSGVKPTKRTKMK